MDEMKRRRVVDQESPTASERVEFASLPDAVRLRLCLATPGRRQGDQARILARRLYGPAGPVILEEPGRRL
ncbi:MAG: hypothetical protein CMJ58_27470 [Planctomycetaceae bacterium]|nr:hypothetical protein [Planctomycetaceae bacterium]